MPRRYGLVCSMAYAGGGDIAKAMNRVENHAAIEEGFRANHSAGGQGRSAERDYVFRKPRRHVR